MWVAGSINISSLRDENPVRKILLKKQEVGRLYHQNVTKLLEDWSSGDQSVPDKLMPLVYDEMRRLAHQYMRREKPGHTLQTAALVNETS
jgi:ECF sigma factor